MICMGICTNTKLPSIIVARWRLIWTIRQTKIDIRVTECFIYVLAFLALNDKIDEHDKENVKWNLFVDIGSLCVLMALLALFMYQWHEVSGVHIAWYIHDLE